MCAGRPMLLGMATSATTMLAEVEAAISALLTGQHSSYSIGARTVTRLDLDKLRAWRDELKWEVQREGGAPLAHVAKIHKPSR